MSVRILGLILVNNLGIKQVYYSCNSWYYEIRTIGFIREYRNDEICMGLVQALIISRLDYGNTLYNKPLSLINRV